MSRLQDLEEAIRQSYLLIRQLEEQLRLSGEVTEKARVQHESEQQWGLIQGHWEEYLALCRRRRLAPDDDIQQICARFAPPADERHVPLLVVVGKPAATADSNWQDVLRTMEQWNFSPDHLQRDYGVGQAELLIHQEAGLPNDNAARWIDFARQFQARLEQLCARVPGRRTFHLFVNGATALGVGLGAAMGTLFQVIVYQWFPEYYPVVDFYTLAKRNPRGVHFLEEPVSREFQFVHVEGDPADAAEVYVSLQLSGPDPRKAVAALVGRQEENTGQRRGTVHITRREERLLNPQDDWILCAREILTALHRIVSTANRERVHLFLSAPVAMGVALGLGLKYFRPVTVWNWSPPEQQHYPVLPLERLGRTAT